MKPLSFKRHRFPVDVISHMAWLDFRFSLSLRDVEELLVLWPPRDQRAELVLPASHGF